MMNSKIALAMNAAYGGRAHALLSASGASIWLNCTPAAWLQEAFPNEDTDFSREGTIAHELAEIYAKEYRDGSNLNLLKADPRFTLEMHDAAVVYRNKIREIVEPLRAAGELVLILLEVKLDYSKYVPEGFGTSDCLILTKRKGWGIDFKYGKGVRVDVVEDGQEPEEDDEDADVEAEVTNEQVKLYALGAYEEMSFEFEEIEEFELLIVQPRMNNTNGGVISTKDLVSWGEKIMPVAQAAWEGGGDYKPGSHCQFCRARKTCSARAAEMMAQAGKLRIARDMLSPAAVAELLPALPDLAKWATELRAWARHQAIDNGVVFPGHKLVAGRSNRFFPEPGDVISRLVAAGHKRELIVKPVKLVGVTALEKLLGKKGFEEELGDLVSKSAGKPTLVLATDKRAEWKPNATADEDFE